MGRFNFEAYNAEIAEKKLQQKRPRVKTFVPLRMSTGFTGRPQQASHALMRFTKTSCVFTSLAVEQFQSYGQYVEFMLQGNLLAMRFLPEPSLYSYKVSLQKEGDKPKQVYVNFRALRKELQEKTDYVNFGVYTYEFLFCHDEKNIFYIELDRPFTKTKHTKK